MKNRFWLLGLIIGFLACSKSSVDLSVDPDGPDGSKNVTAFVNDSGWYARGNAHIVTPVSGNDCTLNRFDFYASNELPYPKGARQATAHDCVGACNTTQMLSFTRVPLAVGRYEVSGLNLCTPNRLTSVSYGLLIGGDAIFSSYSALDSNSGWIEVTRVNTADNVVEGRFELTLLSSDKSKTVRFRSGRFNARLTR